VITNFIGCTVCLLVKFLYFFSHLQKKRKVFLVLLNELLSYLIKCVAGMRWM
jgi:hypothetical protein